MKFEYVITILGTYFDALNVKKSDTLVSSLFISLPLFLNDFLSAYSHTIISIRVSRQHLLINNFKYKNKLSDFYSNFGGIHKNFWQKVYCHLSIMYAKVINH